MLTSRAPHMGVHNIVWLLFQLPSLGVELTEW